MPLDLTTFALIAKPVTLAEGVRVLERDQHRCRYCGLDGAASFENSLIMTVDFIHPRARKGKKDPVNLVAACRPCNVIKGRRVFAGLDDAKAYVLKRRTQLHKEWDANMAKLRTHAATAP